MEIENKEEIKVNVEPEKEETNVQTSRKEEKTIHSNKKNKMIYIGIIIGTILIMMVLLSTIFALLNVNNTNIMSGVSVQGIELSNLNREEAKEIIETSLNQKMQTPISIKFGEFETTMTPEQIEIRYNIVDTIEQAYNIGRKSNIISSNYDIIFAKILGKKIDVSFQYNEDELNRIINDIATKLPGAVVENSYYKEEQNLIITKGKPGLVIDKEELKTNILDKIKSQNKEQDYIEISAQKGLPTAIDIVKIHDEVYKEPKDAYFTTEPFNIYAETEGIDFAITIEEAKTILQEEKEEYTIPLKITKPDITVEKIGKEAFPHKLGIFTTKYDESNRNRSNNIKLATAKINELVLMPNDIFSYNKVVGERTISAGYKEAAVYSNGQIVNGIGGGICQVSSTLYNSALLANLEIVDRINHCFLPSYVTAGRDATVSYGTIDFKFKNSRKYPIKLICSAENGILSVEIYGIKEEVEYEVTIQSKIIGSIPSTTKYIEDSSLGSGEEKVIQSGFKGFRSETYKVLKHNGAEVSTTLISRDTYNAMQRIVARGTYVEQQTVTPPVEETSQEQEPIQETIPETNATAPTENTVPEDNNI